MMTADGAPRVFTSESLDEYCIDRDVTHESLGDRVIVRVYATFVVAVPKIWERKSVRILPPAKRGEGGQRLKEGEGGCVRSSQQAMPAPREQVADGTRGDRGGDVRKCRQRITPI